MHHRGADGRGGISCNRNDPKSITATILQTVSSSVISYASKKKHLIPRFSKLPKSLQ